MLVSELKKEGLGLGYGYLALPLRVLVAGACTHNSYFVNIQTDDPISTDLCKEPAAKIYLRRLEAASKSSFSSLAFENKANPPLHLTPSSLSNTSFSFLPAAVFSKLLPVLNPYATQRKSPPAAYWARESRVSPSWIGVLACSTQAEGMRMVDPEGNWQ